MSYTLLTSFSSAKKISMAIHTETCTQCGAGVTKLASPACEYCGVVFIRDDQTPADEQILERAYIEDRMKIFLGRKSYTDAVYFEPDGSTRVVIAYFDGENVTIKFENGHPQVTVDRLIAEKRVISPYNPS